ncbi:MAG: aminoacyl--tRNA ligase-related protein [Patescibacteria group bacterium]
MKQSQLFSKTSRNVPKDETSVNAQLLIRAGFVDKLMAGAYSYLPLGYRVLKNIEAIVREEIEKIGGQEILMPALQPKANWETTGRWDTYDTLFRFTSHYSASEYALGPTHEEIISPLAGQSILSYQDLPKYVFQIQTKFRDEKRAKSGLLRGREFLMKDLYSFHADESDLDDYYEKVRQAYVRIYDRLGIGESTYFTFASGGTFAKYSHEFQTVTGAGEDAIYICDKCRIAINKEIIEDQSTCPTCGSKDLNESVATEVGNIFKLKTKYSAPFKLVYKDKNGGEKEVIMGCYGIGISRLMGVIAEMFNDDKGLIWPEAVAPFKAHLLALGDTSGDDFYRDLQAAGVQVLYDDRAVGAGEKFVDADLIGLPWRIVVSPKLGDQVEIKNRRDTEVRIVSKEEALKILKGE